MHFEMPKARDAAYMERWRRVKKGRGEVVGREVVGREVVGADRDPLGIGCEAGLTGI